MMSKTSTKPTAPGRASGLSRFARSRRGQVVLGVVACAAIGTTVGVLVSGGGSAHTPAYANVSRNYRACLMNETSGGSAGDQSLQAATWAGLQQAAKTGRVNAERLPLAATSAAAAAPYFNGAVQQHCGLVVAVGSGLSAAVDTAAAANAHQQYLLVGGASTRANVRTIAAQPASSITSATYSLVMSLAKG